MQKEIIKITDVEITPDGYLLKKGRVLRVGLVNGTLGNSSFPKRLRSFWRHYLKSRLARPKKLCQDLLGKPVKRIDEDCIWITDDWSGGYFHWITEALPRLLYLEDSERLDNKTLLLPSKYKDKGFVSESLQYFDIKNIKYTNSSGKVLVKNLLVSPHVARSGVHNEEYLNKLREKFRGAVSKHIDKEKKDRVYISRSRTKRRKAVNSEEVEYVLRKNGFNIVHFEDHPWQEQVKMCLNAKYLVGIHGAGLVNMLFMPKDGTVLELRNEDYFNKCFKLMADKLNLNYLNQASKPTPVSSGVNQNNVSLSINFQTLERNVQLMLEDDF